MIDDERMELGGLTENFGSDGFEYRKTCLWNCIGIFYWPKIFE